VPDDVEPRTGADDFECFLRLGWGGSVGSGILRERGLLHGRFGWFGWRLVGGLRSSALLGLSNQ
jgi:hypothetical protein